MPSKRLLLTGVYNTRPGTGALSGSSGVIGFGIIGSMIIGNGNVGSAKDHRLVNRLQITQSDAAAGSKQIQVVKRPGHAASFTPRAGHIGNAIYVWGGQGTGTKIMSCFGNTNFKLYDSATDKGDGTGKATGITETKVSDVANLLITSSDNTAWVFPDAGTLAKIVDVDFPANASRTIAGNFASLDGYQFIMDTTGRIYNSDLNSATAWTSASYITANSIPDVGVGVVRHRQFILGMCKEHFDVFRNAGNATGSPLSRIDELSQLVGCISAEAITTVRDTVYFVGSTKSANLALYAFSGGEAKPISTPEQDAALAIAGPSNISVTTEGFYGRQFVVVCASTSTFAYCVEENNWHEWAGTQLWYKAAGVGSGASIVNYSISKTSTSGKVYVLNPANVVFQDDGVSYTAMVQSPLWDSGTKKKKTVHEAVIVGDQEMSTATLYVSYSDDDYQTWSTPRSVDLSTANPKIQRCGETRRRAFRLTDSENKAMRMEAIDLTFTPGAL